MPPRIAVFPKCYLKDLCSGKMSVYEWIEIASELPIEGLEFYSGFLPEDQQELERIHDSLKSKKLEMPMFCCSPDFTQPDESMRDYWVEKEKEWIDLTRFFGGKTCRVLSGQRRPGVSREEGIDWVVNCINRCLEYAGEKGVILALENHYKDDYWKYPEFAQKLDVFLEITNRVHSKWFGVNFDPSNAILAGDEPLTVLNAVKNRLVSMHASDRYLASGNIADLKEADGVTGYSSKLQHGAVGKGLVDYDAIFSVLSSVRFDGWISIEDGVQGIDQIEESAHFLIEKIRQHFV